MNKRQLDNLNRRLSDYVEGRAWREPFTDTAKRLDWYERYQRSLPKLFSDMDLTGVSDAGNNVVVALADIHVEERFTERDLTSQEGMPDFRETLKKEPSEDIIDLLLTFDDNDQPLGVSGRAVVIGPPGSGKTVLTRSLVVSCGNLWEDNRINIALGQRMVMSLVLRELDLQDLHTTEDLLNLYRDWFLRRIPDTSGQLAPTFVENMLYFLNKGWVIIAVDGMDEVGQAMRQRLHGLVYALAARFPNCAILVTGRPVGLRFDREKQSHEKSPNEFHDQPSPATWRTILEREKASWSLPAPMKCYFLRPFDDKQVEYYTQRWMAIRYSRDVELQKRECQTFLRGLEANSGLRAIRRRPIYLTLLAYIHGYKALPNSQTQAYQDMVSAYLSILDRKKFRDDPSSRLFEDQDKWRILERLAWSLHTKVVGGRGANNDKKEDQPFHLQIARKEFEEKLTEWAVPPMRYQKNQVRAMVDYFLARTGLLVELEKNVICFSHLSFQEFLAASYLTWEVEKQDDEDKKKWIKDNLLARLENQAWHPVGIHFFGIQSIQKPAQYQEKLLRGTWLKEKPTSAQWLFLHRLFSEGEHALENTLRQELWERFWKEAMQHEDARDWYNALEEIAPQWHVWPDTVPGFMLGEFLNLPSDEKAAWPLVLFSFCSKDWLGQQWEAIGKDAVENKWGAAIRTHPNLFWALDCHGTFPQVGIPILHRISLRHSILYNQWYPPPISVTMFWSQMDTQRNQLLQLYWNSNGLIYSVHFDQVVRGQSAVGNPEILVRMALALDRDLAQAQALVRARALARALDLDLAQARDLAWARARALDLAQDLARVQDLTLILTLALALAQDLTLILALARDLAWDRDLTPNEQSTLYAILSLWSQSVTYLLSNPNPDFNPKRVIAHWEEYATNEQELKDLFAEEWFPYQALKALADEPFVPMPVEAASVSLFRLLRFLLEQHGQDVRDLPADLDIQPGAHFRKFYDEATTENYLNNLREAGWDGAWPPPPVDWSAIIARFSGT